jgi:hypothetical protein
MSPGWDKGATEAESMDSFGKNLDDLARRVKKQEEKA